MFLATSLATLGAGTHCLQRRTNYKIQNDC